METLERRVALRPEQELAVEDSPLVEELVHAMASQLLVIASHLDPHVPVSAVQGFNERLHLYEGPGINIRVHRFFEDNDGVAHSHSQAFFIFGLSGSYIHTLWTTLSSTNGSYFQVQRWPGNSWSKLKKMNGSVEAAFRTTFGAGQLYFISPHALHSAEPVVSGSAVVTFAVRSTKRQQDTAVFVGNIPTEIADRHSTALSSQNRADIISRFSGDLRRIHAGAMRA